MPRALKGRMPRICGDHRSHLAKQLRVVYDEIISRYPVTDAIGRREALLTAQAWVKYQRLTEEIERLFGRKRGRGTALALRRLDRQQGRAMLNYRHGLEQVKALAQGPDKRDLAKRLAAIPQGASR